MDIGHYFDSNQIERQDAIKLRNGNQLTVTVYYGMENDKQIKRIITRKSAQNNSDRQLYQELMLIDEENILKMYNSIYLDNHRITLFDYEQYTLRHIIYETEFLNQEDMVDEYLLQIAKAVSFLHQRLICHSYINVNTIYVENCLKVKLGGLYFPEKLEQPNSTIDITVNTSGDLYYDYWTNGVNPNGLDYDIWCIGLVLYEMLFREQPQPRFNVEERYNDLSNNYGYSKNVRRAFRRMLRPRPITYNIAALLFDFQGRIVCQNRDILIQRIEGRERIYNRYIPEELLGAGAHGYAYKVTDEQTGEINKTKVIKVINPQNHDGVDAFRETIINRLIAGLNPEDETIRNIHVVGFYDCFLESGSLCLVTEYCHDRDLKNYISMKRQDRLQIPENILTDFIYQLIVGIRFIHGQSVIHRDIKPSNILLHRDPTTNRLLLKYCDFGLSRRTDEIGGPFKTLVGTTRYAAPEILRGSTQLNNSIDIWSLGCVIYELITQEYLFPNPDRIISKISDSNWSLPINNYNKEFRNLLLMMLQINPGDRADSQVLFERVRDWRPNQ